ncbi:MAG TPA: thioredoxin domain-containing protein [Candidatus Acidoferrales bacterium]|nr:thioredoxin domain-containing protein [Candidatus Acidoferrales bacterium]
MELARETHRAVYGDSRYNPVGAVFAVGIAYMTLEESVRVPPTLTMIAAVVSLLLALDVAGQVRAHRTKATTPPDLAALKAYGSKTAPITMEVFSDYQCPSCRAFYQDTYRLVIDNYVSSGKVYLVHRDFPLNIHAYSRQAARYANAAARIGKFDKAEEALYAKQDAWDKDGNLEGALSSVLTPSEMAKVRKFVNGNDLDAAIEKDMAEGNNLRVTQTPTIIITCKGQTYPISGGVSYPVLRQFFDQLLKQ